MLHKPFYGSCNFGLNDLFGFSGPKSRLSRLCILCILIILGVLRLSIHNCFDQPAFQVLKCQPAINSSGVKRFGIAPLVYSFDFFKATLKESGKV